MEIDQTEDLPAQIEPEQINYRPYVSLHNHTTFSIMDSLIKPIDLFERAKEIGQTAIAVTDHGTLSGMWDCLKASKKTGVKLIAGCEFYFVDDVADIESRFRHIVILAKNAIGYRNLLLISKEGFDNNIVVFKKVYPRIDWKILEKYSEGLICTTACGSGIVSQLINNKKFDEAKSTTKRLKDIFGDDLAIEIQAHAMRRNVNLYSDYQDQTFTNNKLIEIANELDVRIIVTTDAHYLNKEDWRAHDVWLAMSSGQPVNSGARLKYNVNDFYLKTSDEIFDKIARNRGEDFAEKVIENTLYFANKCEQPDWIDPKFSNPSGKELPEFPVKDQSNYEDFKIWCSNLEGSENLKIDALYLRYWCFEELNKLSLTDEEKKARTERLNEEFGVFEFHDFSSYMLIVADIMEFAYKNDIRVGPGRGSVGGSFVGFLLKIHLADPFKYGLIFARFHNKEKKAFPDIDMDFAPSGRDKIINYVKNKYGDDYVVRVGNIITLTPKPYVKAIARTFLFGGDRKSATELGMKIAETIPDPTYSGIRTVTKALEKAPLFAEYAIRYPELAEFSDFSGNAVALATHAAGFVIGKRPLPGLVPLRRDKDGDITIEYEKERVEAHGLVKMDFLGLETLDIITETRKLIIANGKTPPAEPFNYDLLDDKVYDMVCNGDTFCVFQLGESAGTIDLCKKVKPRCIEDLAIINALARPSARDIRKGFIEARQEGKDVELLHPLLQRAFKQTYGFGLFEECLMYLGQDLCGWTMHEADRLRKFTKEKGKHPDKDKKLKKDFINSSMANGVSQDIVIKIWDSIINPFGSYAFNKSHAILYSLTGVETAYYKAYFPLEFLVANLMSKVGDSNKKTKGNISKIKEEIKRLDVNIRPPDINNSEMAYKIIDDGTLITGLDAIKHVGNAIPEILAQRPFKDFADFLTRCDSKTVRADAIQALAASGCLDSFGVPRKMMYFYASDFKKKLQLHLKRKKGATEPFNYPWPEGETEWTIPELFALEHKYIGEGLTGNKKQVYKGFFNDNAVNFSKLKEKYPEIPSKEFKKKRYENDSFYEIIGIEAEIKSIFEFTVKKEGKIQGQTMARVTLEDPYGNNIDMVCFPEKLENLKKQMPKINSACQFEVAAGIKFVGIISWYEGDISIIFDSIMDCCTPPALPADLKDKKKVSMKISAKDKDRDKKEIIDAQVLLEEVEDELIEEGYSDLDEEEVNI